MIGYPVNPDDLSHGYVWIAEDRTRQRRDEQALREALQENQAIFDTAVLGIAVVENGHTLHGNRKMEELFGHAPGAMAGVSIRVAVSGCRTAGRRRAWTRRATSRPGA